MTITELRTMLRLSRQIKSNPAFRPRAIDLDQLTEPVYCPGCARVMEVQPVYGPGREIIDGCARCGVVWIDGLKIPMTV